MKDYSVFAEENRQEYADVLQALTEIPSPSYRENRIAELIKKLLCGYAEKSGYDQVHIYEDDICNVYCELGEAFEPGSECFAVTAHTDTVFPDMEDRFRLSGTAAAGYTVWNQRQQGERMCVAILCKIYF